MNRPGEAQLSASLKPAWPLLGLALFSFIPGVGFLLGSAAVTWGLLTERPHARLAIGIGATGALAQIFVVAFFMATSKPGVPTLKQEFSEMARRDLVGVALALEAYHRRESAYPASLLDLRQKFSLSRPLNLFDFTAGVSLRPAMYQYRVAADGASYDLFAVGPDGMPDTPDDIRPVLPDSLRSHSGLRAPP